MTKRELLKQTLRTAGTEIERLGMKRRGAAYVLGLRRDVRGLVQFNVAMDRGEKTIGISPVVSIRHDRIEERLQSLCPSTNFRFMGTLGRPIGYLMPEHTYREWYFEPEPFDSAAVVDEMALMIQQYGLPFMTENSSLEAITRALEEKRFSNNDSIAYRLPLAYLLSGRVNLAAEYVRKHLAEMQPRQDIVAGSYREFGTNFLRQPEVEEGRT
jgi:hypothetical protein